MKKILILFAMLFMNCVAGFTQSGVNTGNVSASFISQTSFENVEMFNDYDPISEAINVINTGSFTVIAYKVVIVDPTTTIVYGISENGNMPVHSTITYELCPPLCDEYVISGPCPYMCD